MHDRSFRGIDIFGGIFLYPTGQAPEPSPEVPRLDRLVGTWDVAGPTVSGRVTYEWLEGGFFLFQHVDIEQEGHRSKGLEVIGQLRPFGETEPSADIRSRYYGDGGETFDYTYEIEGDTPTTNPPLLGPLDPHVTLGSRVAPKDEPMSYTVGAVARMAGVTVRTLHHYDEIGLLRPNGRSDAGYRRYGEADLDRLQRILFYRELGFGLDQIKDVMTDGDADAIGHLRRQHAMLLDRIGRLKRMAAAVETAMEARTIGISLTPEERFEVFGDHDPEEYAAEVEERWGDTDAYKESQRRVARYTKADWDRVKAEGQAAIEQVRDAMNAGKPAESVEAMDGAEAHRRQIHDAFYPLSYEGHVGLAEMYLADARFTATYEKIAPGLAQYLHDAIKANAARQAG